MALFRFYKDKAFTPAEVSTNFNSLSTGSQDQIALDATVIDPEHTPTYLWTDTGTGTSSGTANFSDSTSLTPTASFTEAGSYILRLTADDGYDQSYDEITITVNPSLPATYFTWTGDTFSNPFTDIDPDANPDGDSSNNLMEFAFGTDPTLSDGGPLTVDGNTNGQPIPLAAGANSFEFYFIRRDDHGTPGSVTYTPQFSTDLTGFTDSTDPITFVTDSTADIDYEVVKVPFPTGARFGRIQIEAAP